MNEGDRTIDLIAQAVGILSGYKDTKGAYIVTSDTAKRAILEGLGLEIGSGTSALRTLEELRHRATRPLDPLIMAAELEPCRVPLKVHTDIATLEIVATDEGGASRGIPCEVRRQQSKSVLIAPPFESGYYRLSLRTKTADVAATLIVSPSHCWLPGALEGDMRGWGATSHVYGLRSDDDFGIGDFTLIGKAAEACGKLGASFLGLNPLHALFSADRTRFSPYCPSSRLFLEPLYIDTRAAANRVGVPWRELFNDPHLLARAAQLRNSNLVDYEGVWQLKREILERLWTQTNNSPEQLAFGQFKTHYGESSRAARDFRGAFRILRSQGISSARLLATVLSRRALAASRSVSAGASRTGRVSCLAAMAR